MTGASDFHIRLAAPTDAEDLWRLAHADGVREHAFDASPIPLASHLKWFGEKIASNASRIWVLELAGQLTAQVRYDREDSNTAIVDFAVDPTHRGRGIGTEMLRLTWPMACRELGVLRIRALVISTNAASSQAFLKAGFRECESVTERDRACRVFETTCDFVEITRAK
jgi:RimJ/RimL family protein N-acetyltransferase